MSRIPARPRALTEDLELRPTGGSPTEIPDREPVPSLHAESAARRSALRGGRTAARVLITVAVAAVLLAIPSAAFAAPDPNDPATATLAGVITNIQTWVMGILAALATLFLVLAGVYWATAGGDPAQVDKAKGALKNALIGYGLAVLAPVLLQVVKGIVGG